MVKTTKKTSGGICWKYSPEKNRAKKAKTPSNYLRKMKLFEPNERKREKNDGMKKKEKAAHDKDDTTN